MKLYGRKISGNCHKIRLALSFLKLTYEDHQIQLLQQREDWFLKLTPFAQVPLLEDEGATLSDSLVILQYLCEVYDKEEFLLPQKAQNKMIVLRWVVYSSTTMHLGLTQLFLIEHFNAPLDLDQAQEQAINNLNLLEARLSSSQWLALGKLTLADLAVYPYVARIKFTKLNLRDYSGLSAWAQRIEEHPLFTD